MARTYADQGIDFIFVYTREAHPGEHYPAHQSIDQKLAHARAFKSLLDVDRPILVDDFEGTGHRLYGTLPNMTYLVGRGGRVLFRADWTDPLTIAAAIDYVQACRARRRDGLRLAPFYAEIVGQRWNDQARFQEGLERAGPRAVEEFAQTMQPWSASRRPGRIDLPDEAGHRPPD